MEIRDLFTSKGFQLKDSNISNYFGDYYYIYTNGEINFRLISDKSIISIDVSNDSKHWYDLALVKALLYKNTNLNSATTFEEYIDFLQNNLNDIIALFDIKHYLTTKKNLEKLENERAKHMFTK